MLATAVSESPEAFVEWVGTRGHCGVSFHAVRAAHGTARAATTIYLGQGHPLNRSWITLHQQASGRWTLIPRQAAEFPESGLNEPSLRPVITRNYGEQDPLKIVRLDLTMEKIRVRFTDFSLLRSENADVPGHALELDRSYVPLLARYRRSPDRHVRYAAEFALVRLDAVPDLGILIEAANQPPTPEARVTAYELLSNFVKSKFQAEGRDAIDPDRGALIRAALALSADKARSASIAQHNIIAVRQWQTLGLVSVRLESNGFSMLFEQREGRWIFLAIVLGWIS